MGGVIVPVLQTLFLTVIVLSVERYIALSSAKGKGNITKFVAGVKACLAKNDIAGAKALCSKQKGSVANVVAAALVRYEEMDQNTVLSKEQKIATLQKEVEEATAMEMPSLQQNLPIVATMMSRADIGIPINDNKDLTTPNEFQIWMRAIYSSGNDNLQASMKKGEGIAVKADQNTPYEIVHHVLDNLQTLKMNRFSLMTALKTEQD